MCIGDYNEILNSDKRNGGLPKSLPPMLDFQSALLYCGLIDLGYNEYRFTWRNGRAEEAFVEERLDRACASVEWLEMHLRAKVIHLTASYSNHDLILLDTNPVSTLIPRRRHKLHRFEERWVIHPKCEQVIRDSWTQSIASGSPMNRLLEKKKMPIRPGSMESSCFWQHMNSAQCNKAGT
ncbi:uncharacterized protein LOC142632677 [Castanea sativa]|uniref:uncharacterized protein LOC142632677 n=1 Tax=Castanea sativa TaxID=21020 RepID=UPI003F6519BD